MTENTLLIGLVVFIVVFILTKSGNKCEKMKRTYQPSNLVRRKVRIYVAKNSKPEQKKGDIGGRDSGSKSTA